MVTDGLRASPEGSADMHFMNAALKTLCIAGLDLLVLSAWQFRSPESASLHRRLASPEIPLPVLKVFFPAMNACIAVLPVPQFRRRGRAAFLYGYAQNATLGID